jgi:hypothetical protein
MCQDFERTGVAVCYSRDLPMSIAGILKEVTTITVSAWVFGDELTTLNILGVGITFVGATATFYPHPLSLRPTRSR